MADVMEQYLSNINRTIGDNMRFARNFQAQPQTQAASSGDAQSLSEMIQPLLMLMLFQMMQPMLGAGAGTSLPSSGAGVLPSYGLLSAMQNPATSYLMGAFQQKLDAVSPSTEQLQLTDAEMTAIQQDITEGQLSEAQVGQALKFLLVQADAVFRPVVGGLIAGLGQKNALNVVPFMQDTYLERLQPVQRETLLGAVTQTGLTVEGGQTNVRLASFLIEAVNRPGSSPAKQFARDVLQALHKPNDPALAAQQVPLRQILALSNTTVASDGETLVFTAATGG